MGGLISKQEEESEISTPYFERYADMTTLENDPRSPSGEGVTRTPIVLQSQLTDPRSPSECVTRTPVFAIPEPISPCIRFKMDNHGFQDSPLSTGIEKLKEIDTDDTLASEIENLELTNDEKKNESSIVVDVSPLSSKDDKTSLIQNKQEKKNLRRRASNKNKNLLLKQALFKPYVDENASSHPSKKSISSQADLKRKPLQSKTNILFSNENVLQSAEKSIEPESPLHSSKTHVKKKLPLIQDGTMDKENVSVY